MRSAQPASNGRELVVEDGSLTGAASASPVFLHEQLIGSRSDRRTRATLPPRRIYRARVTRDDNEWTPGHLEEVPEAVTAVRALVRGNEWVEWRPTTPVHAFVNGHIGLEEMHLEIPANEQVRLEVTGISASTKITVSGRSSSVSRMELVVDVPCHVEVASARVDLTRRANGRPRSRFEDLLCRNAEVNLGGGSAVRVRVVGDCSVSTSDADIGELAVRRGSKMKFQTGKNSTIERIKSYGSMENPEAPHIILASGSNLVADRCAELIVSIERDAHLSITSSCKASVLRGAGAVTLGGLAADVQFQAPIRLSTLSHSTISNASGNVVLERVENSTIVGRYDGVNSRPPGLEIVGIGQVSGLSRVTLDGVRFPISSEGLEVMSALAQHALQVTPAVHGALPGRRRVDRAPWARRWMSPEEILFNQIYAQELASLAEKKSTTGASRTILSWCAYRMRNLAAAGMVERTLLSFYRLIGYGERTGPALLTYFIIALSCTLVSEAGRPVDLGDDGVRQFGGDLMAWLITPLHLLDLTESTAFPGDLPRPVEVIFRVIIAIPFVTGVLALRKYAKQRASAEG